MHDIDWTSRKIFEPDWSFCLNPQAGRADEHLPAMRNKYHTSFPVVRMKSGRIKRIMQRDDEVGKIAQAAPLAISKAVDAFLQSLLNKAADVVRETEGRRLLPAHLKRCIQNDKLFDFLTDIVKDIPDIEPDKAGNERGAVKRRRESSHDPSKPTRRRVSKARKLSDAGEASPASSASASSPLPPPVTIQSSFKLTLQVEASGQILKTEEDLTVAPVPLPSPQIKVEGDAAIASSSSAGAISNMRKPSSVADDDYDV